MAEEELELDLDNNEEINREKDRNKKLADKVKTTSEERDALAKAKEEEVLARSTAEKERDYYTGFTPMTAKYPGSVDFQDKILEKTKLGLDIEEATMLVMAKEGKYTPPTPAQEKFNASGGSANTTITSGDSKTPQEMSQAERKSALEEAFAKGELSL